MKKVYIQTYGCQMNQHDSQRILQVLRRSNYTPTSSPENADLIFLNTCSVRDKAEQKVYSALGRWRELKERNRGIIIGVGGCVAQQEGELLLKRVPHLDLVCGTHNIHKLPEMVGQAGTLGARPMELAFYRDPAYMEDLGGRPRVHVSTAFVTIMQGCNNVCSFCIVPHVRGRELSRPSASIIGEIRELAARGVKEVMLLGQNVNSYGKTSGGELTFPELLTRINKIGALERIRFMTSHPQDLSPELIEAYATLEKLCEHLHLPVQSGSDSVLRRMRRGYTRDAYLEKIRRLRRQCPKVALSTDIIVGFPGETEAEFAETLAILRQVAYDEIYSFMYSPRPHTVAVKLYGDDVSEEVKKERLAEVQRLQNEISLRKNKHFIGAVQEILVEGPSKLKRGQITGRTRTNKIVNSMGPITLSGSLTEVKIAGASANSLLGELPAVSEIATLRAGGIA
ncbi:MAG: tRNA (N6-isopentenyl adenosine(37)-C2)-methylthiotransferase MiaB [Deltaproteobacteria bacterium]|nr:tRNA (N6-isopentenyl adenosine(37)-C2)-methylthiotransferase MiaB [Deltaproteobacteria bacterium]